MLRSMLSLQQSSQRNQHSIKDQTCVSGTGSKPAIKPAKANTEEGALSYLPVLPTKESMFPSHTFSAYDVFPHIKCENPVVGKLLFSASFLHSRHKQISIQTWMLRGEFLITYPMVRCIWDIYLPQAKRSKHIRDDQKAIIKNSCSSRLSFNTRNWASQVALVVKNPSANAGDISGAGSTLGSGRSPGGGHDNPLQYSCLGNPMDRGAWRATVHGISKSGTQLKRLSTHADTHKTLRFCFLAFGNYQNEASTSGLLRPICDTCRRFPL